MTKPVGTCWFLNPLESMSEELLLRADESDPVPELQRTVQRKLGRCMVRLQQYERLIKALIAGNGFDGPIDQWQDIKARRIAEVSGKTLGYLIGEFTGKPPKLKRKRKKAPKDPGKTAGGDDGLVHLNFRAAIEMEEQEFNETIVALNELVTLRNDLVHHLLDKYDIWTESGCVEANLYLDRSYAQIDAHFERLRQWNKRLVEVLKIFSKTMDTPEFQDLFDHGIQPGGAGVHWGSCTIVELLQDAEKALAQDGWTSLADAITRIRLSHPDHTPERYGCVSWPQLLHESRQFDIRKEQVSPGAPKTVKYRGRIG